ncbi:universal stress protein [Sulfitobacter sp. LCG007]
MYKNVLVPVVLDHTRAVEKAIDVAKLLADAGAAVTLLHVVEIIPDYVSQYIPPDLAQTRRHEVDAALGRIAAGVPGGKVAVETGRAGHEIVRRAKESGCDCIVIASHAPELADILLGSTANYVVRHAACAVHVLR